MVRDLKKFCLEQGCAIILVHGPFKFFLPTLGHTFEKARTENDIIT